MAKRDELQHHLEGLFSDLSAEPPRVEKEEEKAPQPAADDLLRLFGEAPEAPTPAPEPGTLQMPGPEPPHVPEPEPAQASAASHQFTGIDTLMSVPPAVAQGESVAQVATPRRRLSPSTAQKMFVAFLLVALVPLVITLIFGNTLFVILVALAIAGILALQLIQVSGWSRVRTATETRHPTETATGTPAIGPAAEEEIAAAELQTETAALEQTIEQLQQQAHEWAAGAEIARAVASSLDPQQVLQVAADTIRTRFQLHNVTLYLVDQSATSLAAVASSAEAAPEIVSRSQLAVPLWAGGKRLGAMEIHSTEADAFSEQKALTYAYLADMVAVALLNAKRYTEKKQLADNQEMATRLTDRMTRETELEEVVTVTLRQLGKTYKLSQATLALGIGAELTVAGNSSKKEAP